MKRLLGYALCSVIFSLLLIPTNSVAQGTDSQLKQTVKPIECTFTRTMIINDQTTHSICNDQNAPTFEMAFATATGKQKITGKLPMNLSTIKMFRIWLASNWYTYNISPFLSINTDNWVLNLDSQSYALSPGDYTVIIELETTDSILLRSIYDSVLSIPNPVIIETITDTGPLTTIHWYIPKKEGGYIIDTPSDPIVPMDPGNDNQSGDLKEPDATDATQSGYAPILLTAGAAVITTGTAVALFVQSRKRKNDSQ